MSSSFKQRFICNKPVENKNEHPHPGVLLYGPDAFGFFQLPQGLVPLGELLWQQEHLQTRGQTSPNIRNPSTFFFLQNYMTKINQYTILLYSSKTFFTSCDWVSIWSWKESNVESEVDKKQRGESDDDHQVHFISHLLSDVNLRQPLQLGGVFWHICGWQITQHR